MQEIMYVIIVFLLSWFVLDKTWYSPKARIKRLKKKMYLYNKNFNYQTAREVEKITGTPDKLIEADKTKQKLINIMIDEYLDNEDDQEFIDQYKDEEFIK